MKNRQHPMIWPKLQSWTTVLTQQQTSESSLPLLLDVIFGMIFHFQSALGILKNFLSVPFSIIIYPNTNKC